MAINYACNCCAAPPCDEPILECRSVSCILCGTTGDDYPADQTRYATVTTVERGMTTVVTWSMGEFGCEFNTTSCSGTITRTNRIDLTFDAENDCSGGTSGSGYEEVITTQTWTWNAETNSCEEALTQSGTSELHITFEEGDPVDCSRTYDGITWTGPSGNSCLWDHHSGSPFGAYYPCFTSADSETFVYVPDPGEGITTTTYSAPATCDFPEYALWPGETGTPPPALEYGQARGTTCAAVKTPLLKSQMEWRIKHAPTGTCYLKVWLRKTTTLAANPDADPPVVASTTTDDATTYEWTGTSNPCLADLTKAYNAAENLIHSDATEIATPSTDSSVTIAILKWSCLAGYEPDITDPENPQPNGFPDPAWEAAAP